MLVSSKSSSRRVIKRFTRRTVGSAFSTDSRQGVMIPLPELLDLSTPSTVHALDCPCPRLSMSSTVHVLDCPRPRPVHALDCPRPRPVHALDCPCPRPCPHPQLDRDSPLQMPFERSYKACQTILMVKLTLDVERCLRYGIYTTYLILSYLKDIISNIYSSII